MKNKLFKRNSGGAAVAIVVVILILAGVGFFVFNNIKQKQFNEALEAGKKVAQEQTDLFEKGYLAYMQQDYDEALKDFSKAEELFGPSLDFYRENNKDSAKSEDNINKNDITEIKFSLSVVAAYNDFFNMAASSKWVKTAEENLEIIKSSKSADTSESESILKTLKQSAELCAMYAEEKYEEAFIKLLEVEQGALETDRDFFIFEVRFMIASAEALNEPLIMEKAQELLGIMAGKIFDEMGKPDERITTLIRLANE